MRAEAALARTAVQTKTRDITNDMTADTAERNGHDW